MDAVVAVILGGSLFANGWFVYLNSKINKAIEQQQWEDDISVGSPCDNCEND